MYEIVFLTSYYSPYVLGGAEISNKILMEGITKNKKVRIITFGKKNKSEVKKNLTIDRVHINNIIKRQLENYENYEIDSKKLKLLRILFKLRLYIDSNKYKNIVKKNLTEERKIIHSSGVHLFFIHLWWKIAKKNNNIVIHTLRDPIFIYSRLRKTNGLIYKTFDKFHSMFYIYYISRYVDYIHSPTQYMIDLHIKNGFKFKSTKVIPNTIENDFKLIDFNLKKYDLIYVGILSKNKGVKTLIEFKRLNPNLNIIFVGEGDFKEEAIKNGIKVTGWLEQNKVYEYIERAKIVILPSEWEEAFGRVLIEGVASGTLSLGSNMGGIPEVLFNDLRYIFEAKNIIELNKKVNRILNLTKEEYEKELKDLQKKMEIYKYENHIKQFEEFYDEVIKGI